MERARHRQSDLKRMFLGVRTIPSLFIALTSYKLLALLLFMETFLMPGSFAIGHVVLPVQVLFLLACTVVCFGFAVFFRQLTFQDKDWYLGFLTTCLLFGLFMLFVCELGNFGNEELGLICQFLGIALTALGIIGTHIELARIFGALGMTQTLTFGVASALAVAVLYLILSIAFPPFLHWIAVFSLPLILAASFRRGKTTTLRTRKAHFVEPQAKLFLPGRFIATSTAQGTSLGILMATVFFTGTSEPAWSAWSYFAAAAITFVTLLVCKLDFNRAVNQIGFPLIGLGLLYAGISAGNLGTASVVLQLAGFLYLDLVLWGLGSYLIKNCGQPAAWVASCPTTSLMAGRTLGVVLGSVALYSLPDDNARGLLLCAAAFCIVLTALMLSNSANLRTGWGFVRPGSFEEDTNLHRACQIVSEDFGLTQREFDVLSRIVAGESRSDIATSLFIAPNTVKTHLHSIYAKLDVHSESDLRAYVGKQRQTFSPQSCGLIGEEHGNLSSK